MRTLVSLGIFTQTGPESYAHSSLSEALRNPKIRAVVRGMAETASVMVSLPEYLSSINFDNPADHRPSLFGFARDTDKTMFEWLESEPEQRRIFLEFQSASSEMSDFRLRPLLQSLLTQGDSNAEVAFVDVGGGQGETLREVSNAVQPRGRVILQDLPKVIEDLGTDGGVEVMVYNFLEPQPVKGAAIYFFRHIFHNWPDTVSQQILRNTMSAMGPASRIIIVDEVMPNLHAPLYISYIDISMMAFGGLERTEIHWRQLLETTGLRIGKMEPLDPSSSSSDFIIELSL
ncbi:hypothetical protein EYZ11_000240 [Aspergillus tanneri]|uniref:O-methyltransferase C-terminal domain-containing protein n=1 Tax=Aspergillus tanneri TaxID=1220188 RepID=A0A4S3JXS0_9EURO|nr:hypothetical protein EYZ11_000240 [Aspergillus tanneri]